GWTGTGSSPTRRSSVTSRPSSGRPAWPAERTGSSCVRGAPGSGGAPRAVPGPPRPGAPMSPVAAALLPALARDLVGGRLRGALLVRGLDRGRLLRLLGTLVVGLLTVTVLVLGHGMPPVGDLGARAGTRFT